MGTHTSKKEVARRSEAGRLLGRHRNTLSGWLAEGAPAVQPARRSDGVEWLIDLGALLDWCTARAVAAERGRLESKYAAENERLQRALEQAEGDAGEPISRSEALRRRAVAEMRLREIKLAEREGRLIDPAEKDRVTLGLAITTRDKILAVPDAIAPRLAKETTTHKCGRICYDALHAALSEMADAADEAIARLEEEKPSA